MGNNLRDLEVFQGIPARREDIPFYIHPECQDKVDDKGRPHREEGDIDKPGADPGSGNPHSFPDSRTHPKYLPFDEVLHSVHTSNLEKNDKTPLLNMASESKF